MDVDLQVLAREGIRVVNHPASILAVDARSVLVCVEASFPSNSPLTSHDDRLDPSSTRVLRMMEEYELVEFPWDPLAFPPTTRMYIRKPNPPLAPASAIRTGEMLGKSSNGRSTGRLSCLEIRPKSISGQSGHERLLERLLERQGGG
jgi:hypothetical protein